MTSFSLHVFVVDHGGLPDTKLNLQSECANTCTLRWRKAGPPTKTSTQVTTHQTTSYTPNYVLRGPREGHWGGGLGTPSPARGLENDAGGVPRLARDHNAAPRLLQCTSELVSAAATADETRA